MQKLELIRRVSAILEKFTDKQDGNVYYGNYPIIAAFDGHIKIYNDDGEGERGFHLWFLPVGVPYIYNESGVTPSGGVHVAHMLGDRLYVHTRIFHNFMSSKTEAVLSSPIVDKMIEITRGGWRDAEKQDYQDFIFNFAFRSTTSVFRETTGINFEAISDIDVEILYKDGWIVNQVIGRNAFYGIRDCGVRIPDITEDNEIYWFNKYLVYLDVTGGSGVNVYGYVSYSRYPHPHVNAGGALCTNEFEAPLYDRINKGEITFFFLLMTDFLQNYNTRSPYFSLPLTERRKGNVNGDYNYIINKIATSESNDRDED